MTDSARVGTRFRFALPDGLRVPDPASRHQPEDVHGSSEVIDPSSYAWLDTAWRGRPWEEAVLYELHIGAFTPEGTFRAAIDRLDDPSWRSIPVVLMSSMLESTVAERCSGYATFMRKPFTITEVIALAIRLIPGSSSCVLN